MLIKLRAPAGPARTEVLQLAEIFRARVVDVSERGLTLCVSGDPGKVVLRVAERGGVGVGWGGGVGGGVLPSRLEGGRLGWGGEG
mgnify:FL=1